MSRTYKHIKACKNKRYYKERWDSERVAFEYVGNSYTWPEQETVKVLRTCWLDKPGVKTKKRKEVDSEDHWMTTPSWWNNLFHTRPTRGKFRSFCHNAVKSSTSTLEEMLEPEDSKSPHKYYY